MILIPSDPADRAFAIECLLEEDGRHGLSRREAAELLSQLRLAGDLRTLERLSRALAHCGDGSRPA